MDQGRAADGPDATFDVMQLSHDGTVTDTAAPCAEVAQASQLSATMTPDTLWMTCATKTTDAIFDSSDNGSHWKQVVGHDFLNPDVPPFTRIGAISSQKAIVASIDLDDALMTLAQDGTTSKVAVPHGNAFISSIEFTDSTHGLAMIQDTDRQAHELWRTTDGGSQWSVVSFGS
ncbi:MAG: hypothetical protein ACRDV3_00815 [Acidothermaceae bacterium]